MFQCYVQPTQENFSLSPDKHCSSSLSSVYTPRLIFPQRSPNRGTCSLLKESVLATSKISEWPRLLVRLDVENYPNPTAVVPVHWHSTSPSLGVSARSFELIKYRIRKLTLSMRTIWRSLNLYIFWTAVHKHWDMMINGWLLILPTGQGWPVTPAGEGPVRIMPILHKPHTSNCKLPSDSHSICPLFPQTPSKASLLFMFPWWEVSHTWYVLLWHKRKSRVKWWYWIAVLTYSRKSMFQIQTTGV